MVVHVKVKLENDKDDGQYYSATSVFKFKDATCIVGNAHESLDELSRIIN
jgi:hypothetical protein